MATIVERDRAVKLVNAQFAAIAELASDVKDSQWDLATCLPGWSVRDQFAHMIGVERMILGEENPTVDVDVSSYDHVTNEFAAVVELWVESMRSWTPEELRDRWKDVSSARSAVLESQSQADFDELTFTPAGQDTTGRFMRIRHFDLFLHENDMRDALGLDLREDASQLGFALEEPFATIGYVAGKLAGLPDGTSFEIELTGAAPGTHYVELAGGRAKSVDSLAGLPTFAVLVDSHLYLRLSAGRLDGGPLIGDLIEVSGDTEPARQFVENLGYTP